MGGVHMLFDGDFSDIRWKTGENRECRFVFIGRNLDKAALVEGFMKCKVEGPLRFSVGDAVECRMGAGLYKPGRVLKLWDEGNPYRIKLSDTRGTNVFGPVDEDEFVRRPCSS